jgi:hypothetical protein
MPMIYYFCKACKAIKQATVKPLMCDRCLAVGVKVLSTDEVMDAFDKHELAFCATCGIDHSTSIAVHYTR